MLAICSVVKKFGNNLTAVDKISLSLQRGVIGLVGHNGAGKTTLMQMIATLTKPTSGEINFQGVNIVRSPDAIRSRLGFLPQDFGVYPNLSALEFMQYFAALKGVRDPDRIRYLLELVNLTEHAQGSAAAFSGGMRRRLGIAQALLNDPDILLVDEPTAGLDPEERLRFRNLLGELGADKLVIMSTHIVSDVESVASELAIMRHGRLIGFDTPENIIAKAHGQVWMVQIPNAEIDGMRQRFQVLHSQRQGELMSIKIAHPEKPHVDAQLVVPNLEDALMAQRYALQEEA